ncbi:MAG: ATP-binding cassette domain-containing protein [Candidatus Heimdallarchaeota archaeon]|nr:ATP-binding cassette domain-containing protein [Candidatus Heimdallarchaeota archaeon]
MVCVLSEKELQDDSAVKDCIIEVHNLSKIYNKGTPAEVKALDNISFGLPRGKLISIIGPSGSGKSSLLNILGCMDEATSGSVFIASYEITRLPERKLSAIRKHQIGFIFQDFLLVPTLSALENVLLPIIPDGIKKADRERGKTILESVGLGDRIHHKPSELSGGEKQRVAIARALINNPQIILADEPTGNLDSKTGDEILKILQRLNKELGITVVIVTHDPLVMERVDNIIQLKDGKLILNQ